MSESPLIHFYRGDGTDHAGRRLDEILGWPDTRLEAVHDYIQWLFPLHAPSRFNPQAPILTVEDAAVFRQPGPCRDNFLRALRRMLGFYGLECDDEDPQDVYVDPSLLFELRSRIWLTPGNHNYLRLSRILTSARLLGCLSQLAEDQVLCLLRTPGLDAALQGSQLRLARIGVGYYLRQAVHQFLGSRVRLGNKPTVDDWPDMLERVGACSPPSGLGRLTPMRRTDLAGLPGGGKTFEIRRYIIWPRRRYGGVARSARDHLAEPLLSRPDVAQQQHRIEAIELLSQS